MCTVEEKNNVSSLYKIIKFLAKCHFIVAKENAAELPPKLKISAAIFCPQRFVKIARADYLLKIVLT